jgi:STAS-like domain of unknown function (DUF4325)
MPVFEHKLAIPFDEHREWSRNIKPVVAGIGITPDGMDIAEYVTTEMLNNAVDHSNGQFTRIKLLDGPTSVTFKIEDDGAGIFATLARALGLQDEKDAIVELLKGKRTSAPAHHTGEGLYFSARVCEWLMVETMHYGLSFKQGHSPEFLEFKNPARRSMGTSVTYHVAKAPAQTLRQVFDAFCPAPDNRFSRTKVPLIVAEKTEGKLVSRSQAKRIANGLEVFSEVEFDFSGVGQIEQGFADELFRVWPSAHSDISVRATSVGEEVAKLLRHVGFLRPGAE